VDLKVPLHTLPYLLGELGVAGTLGRGYHHVVLAFGELGGEVHGLGVAPVMVHQDEAFYAVVGEAPDGVHEHAHQRLAAEGHRAGERHVVGAETRPARVDADAVGSARHLVDELPAAEAVGAKGQVQPMLLYGSDAYDDDGLGLVLEPVLEGGARKLLYPEPG
jgi:hypothetical protein